jgi:hypothetical protein
MPAPTIANFFGANAQVLTASSTVTASPTAPVLVIRQSDFSAEDWNALTTGQEADPEKWTVAIVRKINTWSNANIDDIPNVVIDNPIVGLESRTSTLKRRFSYSIDIYQPDSGATAPDPDLI